MIKVICKRCGEELNSPGALVFSPPVRVLNPQVISDRVQKWHLCAGCWRKLTVWIGRK